MKIPPLYFIRHGQTDWNAEQRYQGQRDIPLNSLGECQARRNGEVLARHLHNPQTTQLFCSPLTRTRQTLYLVLEAAGWADTLWAKGVIFDKRLIELTFGDWEGWTFEQIKEREPALFAIREADKWNTCMPNGESYAQLSDRVEQWLAPLEHPAVVIAHGGVLRVLRRLIEGVPEQKAPMLNTPQDKIYHWDGEKVSWL